MRAVKLADLEPRLLTKNGKTESVADAVAIDFLCPGCFAKNGGPVGTHHLRVHFAGRDGVPAGRNTWQVSGSTVHDITLQPSIVSEAGQGCVGWHGFVRNGDAS